MSTEAEVPPPRHWLVWAAGCWLAALAVVFAGLVAKVHTGPWLAAADSYVIDGAKLNVRDQSRVDGTAVAIEAAGADGTAVAIINFSSLVEARSYRTAHVHVRGPLPAASVSLVWRVRGNERAVSRAELSREGDRLMPFDLGLANGWTGAILGVGLIVRGDLQKPLIVERIELRPASGWATARAIFGDWFAFEPWDGGSIHFMSGGDPALKHPLPVFLGLAGILGVVFYLLVIVLGHTRFDARAALAIALAGWPAVDARWHWNLLQQHDLTRQQYAGKTWEEKRLAAEDGELFAFLREARPKFGEKPPRIFVFSDEEYDRVRGAYHLYPLNVSAQAKRQALFPASMYKPGDLLVLYRKRGVEYSVADRRLRWEGTQTVNAEMIHFSRGSGVFRVLAPG